MLFHEIYGVYFSTVAKILREAAQGGLTQGRLRAIVQENAFSESIAVIPDALKSQRWPLLEQDLGTPIQAPPAMPLTTLQKRWLKALLLDPRIALFSPPADGLEDVEPLYTPDMIVRFDQYADGDPYGDPDYIDHFHIILEALRQRRKLRVRFRGGHNARHSWICIPQKLEYSEKDDKFRLITASEHRPLSINVARVLSAELLEPFGEGDGPFAERKKSALTLELVDERNALERVMLQFSDLEKETERVSGDRYRMTLRYYHEDETELLIRILAFGPVLRVVAPDAFIALVRERLERQKNLIASAEMGDGQ